MDKDELQVGYSHCPNCKNHSISVELHPIIPGILVYYCPCCDWEIEK